MKREDIHIIIIALNNDIRSAFLSNLARERKFKVTVLPGVNLGDQRITEERNKNYNYNKNRYLKTTEVACRLAHYDACQYVIEHKIENYIVCEDDLEFIDFTTILAKFKKIRIGDFWNFSGQEALKMDQYFKLRTKFFGSCLTKLELGFFYRLCCYTTPIQNLESVCSFFKEGSGYVADDFKSMQKETGLNIMFSPLSRHPSDLKLSHIESSRRGL